MYSKFLIEAYIVGTHLNYDNRFIKAAQLVSYVRIKAHCGQAPPNAMALSVKNCVLPKDRNAGRNQLSMTTIKYDYLQVMETIIGMFHPWEL